MARPVCIPASLVPRHSGRALIARKPQTQKAAFNFQHVSPSAPPAANSPLGRGRDTGCPAPPSQIPAGGIPAPGSSRWHVVFAHRKVGPFDPSFLRHGLPVCASPTRRPLLQFRGCALPLDTMSRSDSRSARRRFLSLRRPSCLALAISAAGTLRVSSVPCVCFRARHALRPRQAFHALTVPGVSVLGSGKQTPSPLASCTFEAEWLKQDATPACGSRVSLGTLLNGCRS